MGYVDNNLLKGERVMHVGKVHWWTWGKGLVYVALAIAIAINSEGTEGLSGFLLLLGIFLIVRGVIMVKTTELAVTNRRVIAKFGLIRRSTIELLHGKVEGMSVNQSIFGRMLGFGTIEVNGTGTSKTPIPHISKPLEFRRSSLEIIEGSGEQPSEIVASANSL